MPAQKKRNKLPLLQAAPPSAEFPVHHSAGVLLASQLLSPARILPAVVVSYVLGDPHRLDARQLAQLLGAAAEVYEIANGAETHRLQEGLPAERHIFGNGARVYPAGPGGVVSGPPPHLIKPGTNMAQLCAILKNEVFAASQHDKAVQSGPSKPATGTLPLTATGVVRGFPSNDRAMVALAGHGRQVLIRGEDLFPSIPLEWLLNVGQQVSGTLTPDSGILDIKTLTLPLPSPVTVYKNGDVALARVCTVVPSHAKVTLWPGCDFSIDVDRISSNGLDSAEDLLTEGEVVRVRVLYDNGAVRLSMLDVDDDEIAVPAPALLAGGPSWLDYDRPYTSIFTTAPPIARGEAGEPEAASEPAMPGVGRAIDEPLLSAAERKTALKTALIQLELARHTIAELLEAQKKQGATNKVAQALQGQLEAERHKGEDLARDLNRSRHELDAVKADRAAIKANLVALKQQRRSTTSRTDSPPEVLFLSATEQFDFELRTAWARSVPAVDKADHPLGNYAVGARFLASLAAVPLPQRNRTLRAVVDLVADMKGPLHNREPHKLRQNEGAHAAPTVRGGDVCWRLYIEQGTAGALRLHYWKLQGGGIELHEVVSHDVVKP